MTENNPAAAIFRSVGDTQIDTQPLIPDFILFRI